MKHVSLSIHDLNGKKVCDLYDSYSTSHGQAYDIIRTTELNGWKEQTFTLPYAVDSKANFRWRYIRNEYRLRIREGDKEDWYTICSPKKSRSNGLLSNTVVCYHSSSILKTKNLYLVFDDTNGIDTCPNLISKVLVNTGWTLGECDVFLERDGKTEKIRSLASEGKVGSYQLITNICNLFHAYPIYHGDTKTVDIHARANKLPMKELIVGKNLSALSADYNSDNIVTRLYVEGEYGDNGYVGIEDVEDENGTKVGFPYLFDFDYYREIGLFTEEHEEALAKYRTDMLEIISSIKRESELRTSYANKVNELWGQPEFVVYLKGDDGVLSEWIASDTISEENKKLKKGDSVLVSRTGGIYEFVEVQYDNSFPANNGTVIKFRTPTSGSIGAKETAIEAKKKMIESLTKDLEKTQDDSEKKTIQDQIASYEDAIKSIQENTTDDIVGLYSSYDLVIGYLGQIKEKTKFIEAKQEEQMVCEGDQVASLGDMLRDGYWSNTNYIPGQEHLLYEDALEMIKVLSKPQVAYTLSIEHATDIWGQKITEYELNSKARIYDPELQINDVVFINKLVEYLDDSSRGNIEISNDDLTLTGKTFDSLLSRITHVADLIEQKASVYRRADAFTYDGNIAVERLNGSIDVLKNKLLSATSNWYTDDSGNIVFLSLDGSSAMMLTGEGFMIASGKDDNGEWNWRTFGTGAGFTADAIVTGYLSADRIEVNSIGFQWFDQEVKDKFAGIDDKLTNVEIKFTDGSIVESVISQMGSSSLIHTTKPHNPAEGALWLDISVTPSLLKRWSKISYDSSTATWVYGWVVVNDTSEIQENLNAAISEITEEAITQKVLTHAGASAIIFSGGKPDNPQIGTLWLNSNVTPPLLMKYDGTSWITVNDTSELQGNVDTLQEEMKEAQQKITADAITSSVFSTKKVIYVGTTPPDDPTPTMLWWDTTATPPTLKQYLWNGDVLEWMPVVDVNAISERFEQAEQKITADAITSSVLEYVGQSALIYSQEPNSPQIGTLWLDTSITPPLLKRWTVNGIWEVVNDTASLDTRISAAEQKIEDDAIISTVTEYMGYGIIIDSSEPEDPEVGMLWLDISLAPPVLKRYNRYWASDLNTIISEWSDVDIHGVNSRLNTAEQKITADGIVSTVTDLVGGSAFIYSYKPSIPKDGMLWLDQSASPAVVRKYDASTETWITINDTAELIEEANNLKYRVQQAEEKITDNSIINTVTMSEKYQDDLENTRTSAVTQTVGELEVRFTVQDDRISHAEDIANGLRNDVDTWFRFSPDGLAIGKEGSPFMTRQDNEEYAFYNNNQKIAYMRGTVLNIPQAYARNVLRIGGLAGIVDTDGNVSWTWVGLDE